CPAWLLAGVPLPEHAVAASTVSAAGMAAIDSPRAPVNRCLRAASRPSLLRTPDLLRFARTPVLLNRGESLTAGSHCETVSSGWRPVSASLLGGSPDGETDGMRRWLRTHTIRSRPPR